MRRLILPLLLLSTVITWGPAFAFNCVGARLPWDVVVCSDGRLQVLADERLAAFEEAKQRLTEPEIQHLREDQAAWVRSYSAACGVRADAAVPSQSPAEVIECFRKAGEARLAYLRAYGASPNQRTLPSVPSSTNAPNAAPALTAVQMEPSDGVYFVPVRINQALTLRFIIDSGASEVNIPADVVLTLVRTGTIAESDFLGSQRYQLADGSTVKSARFILRELLVGDQIARNVPASIGSVEGVPLLGQSFLSNFSSWTLDNDKHELLLGRRGLGRANLAGGGTVEPNAQPSGNIPELPSSKRWVVVASRDDLQEAISTAQKYKSAFPRAAVIKSNNGYYAVVIGQFDADQTSSILDQLVASNRIPKDAYLTLGTRFVSIVWE
jgi:predicted aspartyl protease